MSQESFPIDQKVANEKAVSAERPVAVRRNPWWKYGGEDVTFVSVNSGYPASSTTAASSETKFDAFDAHGAQGVFDHEEAKEIYKPAPGYEGAHRFDPNLTWTPEEEKKLRRKVRVAEILFFNANISSARLESCFACMHHVFCPAT
jgi:hypothetical protein